MIVARSSAAVLRVTFARNHLRYEPRMPVESEVVDGPAQERPEAVAVARQVEEVDEQPGDEAGEAGQAQPAEGRRKLGDRGVAADDGHVAAVGIAEFGCCPALAKAGQDLPCRVAALLDGDLTDLGEGSAVVAEGSGDVAGGE